MLKMPERVSSTLPSAFPSAHSRAIPSVIATYMRKSNNSRQEWTALYTRASERAKNGTENMYNCERDSEKISGVLACMHSFAWLKTGKTNNQSKEKNLEPYHAIPTCYFCYISAIAYTQMPHLAAIPPSYSKITTRALRQEKSEDICSQAGKT